MNMEQTLQAALESVGADMEASAKAVAHLTMVRGAELTALVGQPGYDQAVIAARDEIALAAGMEAIAQSGRILSIVQGGLMLAAATL